MCVEVLLWRFWRKKRRNATVTIGWWEIFRRRLNDRAQEFASGDWFESGLERHFAGLESFESAAPVGVAREFHEDRVAAGGG